MAGGCLARGRLCGRLADPNLGACRIHIGLFRAAAIPEKSVPMSRAAKRKARRRRNIGGGSGGCNNTATTLPNMGECRDQFAALIAIACLPFSKEKNAIFGAFHMATIVAYMLRHGMCANAAIAAFWADIRIDPKVEIKKKDKKKIRFPTDQWLFKLLGSISPEEMEERCDLMLDAQMNVLRDAGVMREVVIDIIDIHNIAHYGGRKKKKEERDKDKYVVRTKAKNGTSRAESYATVLTTSGDYPYCAAATRVVAKRAKSDIVSKLLDDRARRGINAVLTLLDRGFFTVGVMKAFAGRGLHFVMGAVRTAAVKRALDEYIAGKRGAVSRCTIHSGRESFEFTLIIVEKIEEDEKTKEKKKVHVLYATNLPDEIINAPRFDVDELYAKRWDIETHYRKLEEVRPRTVSRSHGARTFFLFTAAVALNMWSMYNQQKNDEVNRAEPQGGPPAAADAGRDDPAPAAGAAADQEKEEGEREGDGEDDDAEEEEEGGAEPGADAGPRGDSAPERDEIVRLALSVQNRPKRKYYKRSKIFFIGVAAEYRDVITSWRYHRLRISRRIEGFMESRAAET